MRAHLNVCELQHSGHDESVCAFVATLLGQYTEDSHITESTLCTTTALLNC